MTTFFLPGIASDEAEALYVQAAKDFDVLPFPLGQRVQSFDFAHNGTYWTATVGKQLHGRREVNRPPRRSRQGGTFAGGSSTRPLSDPAAVAAVFDGPGYYLVLTDGGDGARGASRWENPFMVGHHAVRTVVRFEH